MNKFFVMLTLATTASVYAEQPLEINKKNCNLPMNEIRQLVPDRDQQQIIRRQCAKKASQENWKLKTLVSK